MNRIRDKRIKYNFGQLDKDKPLKQSSFLIQQNILQEIENKDIKISEAITTKYLNQISDEIDQIIETSIVKVYDELEIRIPGKYNGQKQIVKKYENQCKIEYEACVNNFITENDGGFNYTREQLDEQVVAITQWDFGITFEWDGTYDKSQYRALFDRPQSARFQMVKDKLIKKFGFYNQSHVFNIYPLQYYRSGLNYLNDQNVISEITIKESENYGVIYGDVDKRIVYGNQMSMTASLKIQSKILQNLELKGLHDDPFQDRQLDIYSYLCLRNITRKLYTKLIEDVMVDFEFEPFSDINLASKINETQNELKGVGQYKIVFESLEDVRNCIWSSGHRVEQFLASENRLELFGFMSNQLDRLQITPDFLIHYDFKTQKDFRILMQLLKFTSLNLGFQITFQTTGNQEQQKFVDGQVSQATFKCCDGEKSRDIIRQANKLGKQLEITGESGFKGKYMSPKQHQQMSRVDRYYQNQDSVSPPCPFYLRYQRRNPEDINSPYFLNDYNVCHSHPMNPNYVFHQKSQFIRRNYLDKQVKYHQQPRDIFLKVNELQAVNVEQFNETQ